jgi:DNA polymerase III subunit epsilon
VSWFRRKTQSVDPAVAAVLRSAAEHRDRLAELGVVTDEELAWLAQQSLADQPSLEFREAIEALASVLDTLSTPMTISTSGPGVESTVEFDLLHPPPTSEHDRAPDAELEEFVARANSPEVRRLEPLIDAYYAKFEDLDRHRRDGQVGELLRVASECVAMLPTVVDHDRAAHGRWDISSSPAVDALRRFAPIRRDKARLEEAVVVLKSRPELSDWADAFTDAIDNIEIVVRICELVSAEPGTVQAKLGKALGVDGRKTSLIARDLETDSQLARVKAGTSYLLYPPGAPELRDHDAVSSEAATETTSPPDENTAHQVTRRSASPGVGGLGSLGESGLAIVNLDTGIHSVHPQVARDAASVAAPQPPSRDAIDALAGVQFAAIDFETATSQRASACALGVCVVDGGRPVAVRRFLIRPPENRYDPFNTMLHGIGPSDTARAAELAGVWEEAAALIGSRPIVAHNAAFDLGVLRDALLAANVPWPTLEVYCSLVLGRRAWPGLLSYGLTSLVKFCGVRLDDHHDPVADAAACAGITLAVCATAVADDLAIAAVNLGVHAGRLDGSLWDSCRANYLAGHNLARERIAANIEADPEHPLYGRTIVFTGTLDSMPRAQARLAAAHCGAHATTSVSSKTDYLVAGQADYRKFVDGERSAKTRHAEELLAAGHPIEVISEADFLTLLASGW